MNKGVTVAISMAVGARLMYLLDPERGRRRRALLRDKVIHGAHKAGDALETATVDLGHRTAGLLAETRARFRTEKMSDPVLAERVRAKIGHVGSHARAIEVAADHGRVTLSGPILTGEVDALLSAVAAVRGVSDVENRLEVHPQADGVPALQGAGRRREPASWSPATRLLTGTAGGALAIYGAKRRGPMGAAMGTVGLGLLARGLAPANRGSCPAGDFTTEEITA